MKFVWFYFKCPWVTHELLSRRNNMERVLSKSPKLGISMTGQGFAVDVTTSEVGICSAGAQLVTSRIWEVSLGGSGSLCGCFDPGYGQKGAWPCWWQGQTVLWRNNLFRQMPEPKPISFGSCWLLPSQKWAGRSPSLPEKLWKPSLKVLREVLLHGGCGRSAPRGDLSRPHPIVRRGQSRSKHELSVSLSPSSSPQVCWDIAGRLLGGRLVSVPWGTAAATELDTGVSAAASLARPAVLLQHWYQQQLHWFLVWEFGNIFPQVKNMTKKL